MMSTTLCEAFHNKIDEQIDRMAHLAALLPDNSLQRPLHGSSGWSAGDLLSHLLDCMAGFCAALYAIEPLKLAHFQQLRSLPVNRSISVDVFQSQLETYKVSISEAFKVIGDADLARHVPTVFVPEGVSLATLLLGNLEHVINHKRQLFDFLKREGLSVGTADLYRLLPLA
jgi:hypothetical protein